MAEYKYIMLEREYTKGVKQKIPIIFPSVFSHCDIVEAISKLDSYKEITAVSAGFINMYIEETHGSAVSLNINSEKEDANIITMFEYMQGFVDDVDD